MRDRRRPKNVPAHVAGDALNILVLALAVEVLYIVPYGLLGGFRPLFMETFALSNHDVGRMSSAYGIVSMCFYLPGGYIADCIQPKRLMVTALVVTAVCCCCLTRIPSVMSLVFIWGVLAVAGTLCFWSAFVASIRQIGGDENSGKAFGFEQFSRGVVSSLMTLVLARWIRGILASQAALHVQDKEELMVMLLWRLAALEGAMALVLSLALPSSGNAPACEPSGQVCGETRNCFHTTLDILRRPSVWFHALIVIAAYSGNAATGYFSGFATHGYGMDVVRAAEMSTIVTCMRAWAGLMAGLAADRCGRTTICCGLFLAFSSAFAWVGSTPVDPHLPGLLQVQIAACSACVFGLCGVYFTLLDDARLPLELTGSAVGVISVVGFTPDIFMGQLSAYWLDAYPGALGYQLFYLCMASVGFTGLLATLAFSLVVQGLQQEDSGGDNRQAGPSSMSTSAASDSNCGCSASTLSTSASSAPHGGDRDGVSMPDGARARVGSSKVAETRNGCVNKAAHD